MSKRENSVTLELTDIPPQVQETFHPDSPNIGRNDKELIKRSISVLQENVSTQILKIQNDVSNIQRDILKMQRGLTSIYGK